MRVTLPQVAVAKAMLEEPTTDFYGYELAAAVQLDSGTLYAILYRWERQGLLESHLEDIDPETAGRPARRYYRLTGLGASQCRSIADEFEAQLGSLHLRPNLGT